jgi:hypothetical protein
MEDKQLSVTEKIDIVNSWLVGGIPTLQGIFGLVHMVRDMIRRHKAGEPQATFEENVNTIFDGGTSLIAKSDAWNAANGYDKDGNKIVA